MKNAFWLNMIALFCFVASLVLFGPRFFLWNHYSINFPETNRALCEQIRYHDLSKTIPGDGDTIRWRLLFPVLAQIFHLPWTIFLMIPFIGCYALLIYVADLMHTETGRYRWSLAATALVATSSAFFISSGFLAYFDSFLALFLVAAAFERRAVTLWVVATLAVWVDERFVFALPIIVWCQWVRTRQLKSIIPLALGIAPYMIMRLVALTMQADPLTGGALKDFISLNNHDPRRFALGYWDSLRFGWFFAAMAILLVPRSKGFWGLLLLIVCTFPLTLSNGDYSRSTAIALPMVVLGIYLLAKYSRKAPSRFEAGKMPLRKVTIGMFAFVALNFITPAYFSFRAFRLQIRPMLNQVQFYRYFLDYQKTHKNARIVPAADDSDNSD